MMLACTSLFKGESNHGFRRDQVQRMAEQEINQVTQIITLSVIGVRMQGSICSVTQAQVVSRAYSKKLGGVEDTPVVVERDFSL